MKPALLAAGLALALQVGYPLDASAQDGLDVRGGFFRREEVNRSFFGDQKGPTQQPKAASDSWSVGGDPAPAQKNNGYAGSYDMSDPVPPRPERPAAEDSAGGFAIQTPPAGPSGPPQLPDSQEVVDRTSSIISAVQGAGTKEALDRASDQVDFLKNAVRNASEQAGSPVEGRLAQTSSPAQQRILNIENDLKPVLSVVVSASPISHLSSVLGRLTDITKTGVQAGSVIVVGLNQSYPTRVHLGGPVGRRSETPRYPSSVPALLNMYQRASLSELSALDGSVSYSPSLAQKWQSYSLEEQAQFAQKISQPGTEESLASSPDVYSGTSKTLFEVMNKVTEKDMKKLEAIARERLKHWAQELPGLSETDRALLQNDLHKTTRTNPQQVLQRLRPQESPVWIVSYRGKEYVFEGDYSPTQIFDSYGNFKPPS